jgi:F0F1-type ATP synthase assembly protein I
LVLPLAAGVGVDALLHSSPVGFLIGLVAGIVAATAFVVSQFRHYL